MDGNEFTGLIKGEEFIAWLCDNHLRKEDFSRRIVCVNIRSWPDYVFKFTMLGVLAAVFFKIQVFLVVLAGLLGFGRWR